MRGLNLTGEKMQREVKIKNIFSGFIREIRFMGMPRSWRAAYREKPTLGKSSRFSPQNLEGLRIFFPL